MDHVQKHKNKISQKTKKKGERKETMKCPGLIFFPPVEKRQFITILYGEYIPESSIGLKMQLVLLVQGNVGG